MLHMLPQIRCPAMVVAGRHDTVRPHAGTAELAKKIPGARFELIEAGHFMPTQGAASLSSRCSKIFCRNENPSQETVMKIKANGININYQIDGPDGAPWLVFSNSLATSIRDVGRAGRGAEGFVSRAALRPARPRRHRRAGRPLCLRHAAGRRARLARRAVDQKAHFAGLSMGGATALGLAERHPDRFDRIIVCDSPCQSTPQSSQQWEERIAVAQKQGIEALVEPTIARWFPPDTVAKNPPHVERCAP